ncbi:sulfurase [Pseudalgibacter alginicilyticus]|uniref:Sulfurase n=1 Tax=Pseudalgibacter alginicilyticus TaxID=1736674 RepID=A0A0N7HY70_9FLAO|nr:MOSC domain-containing protein [Pseudalgibacter alginicilyticus]ALJ04430.1 sulfurase [Pseudalgibacter alginicilyticus]
MKIISTNIAKPTIITWNGKKETTGIYKTPTNFPIYLGKNDVKDDSVIDRKYHGGEFKACYIFSEMHYKYWKNLYPNLNWEWGMFGENLTISHMDETEIFVGDVYKVGDAIIQISQSREPCYKLGIKFKNQNILKKFITHGLPGSYVKVLKEGAVKIGDELILEKRPKKSLTVAQLFRLLYDKDKDQNLLKLAINNEALPLKKREKFKKFILTH